MDWEVRRASLDDTPQIVDRTHSNLAYLMPYTCSIGVVEGYIDQFLVAECDASFFPAFMRVEGEDLVLGGAVHFVPNGVNLFQAIDKVVCFLELVKQVPGDIVDDFLGQYISTGRPSRAMIGQVICPGRGSFYAILQEAKEQYDEIWCWMSINGPSYKSYQRYGFQLNMDDVREFWNVYKCGYSKFVLGKWRADGKSS